MSGYVKQLPTLFPRGYLSAEFKTIFPQKDRARFWDSETTDDFHDQGSRDWDMANSNWSSYP